MSPRSILAEVNSNTTAQVHCEAAERSPARKIVLKRTSFANRNPVPVVIGVYQRHASLARPPFHLFRFWSKYFRFIFFALGEKMTIFTPPKNWNEATFSAKWSDISIEMISFFGQNDFIFVLKWDASIFAFSFVYKHKIAKKHQKIHGFWPKMSFNEMDFLPKWNCSFIAN